MEERARIAAMKGEKEREKRVRLNRAKKIKRRAKEKARKAEGKAIEETSSADADILA